LTSRRSDPLGAIDRSPSQATIADSQVVRAAVARAKDGETEGLHFLYVRYATDVLSYVGSLVEDHHEAEAITEDVFAKLMQTIRGYEPNEAPFAAWILRIAQTAASGHLRARRGRDLQQALERLPKEQREVLVLRHVIGLSPVEIAGILKQTESSIHGLHQRGRLTLRSAVKELGATPVVAHL
jgi:RNA polymerase sigma-70 factor (ECF subfamily)